MAELDIKTVREEWVGRVFQVIDFDADQERMLEWAIACGETDPRFIDPTHPDFQASPAFPTHVSMARILPDDFPLFGSGRGMDGGKSVEWHRPMRPGDRLRATVEVGDIFEKTGRSGTMVFIVNRMSFFDAEDRLVATVDWRMIRN
jgi:hypothetical protein